MNTFAGKANGASSDSASTADGASSGTSEDQDGKSKKDGEEGDEKEKAPIPVEIAEVLRGEVSSYITASANLVAENDVMVLAEVEGRVSSLFVEEGDWVRRGQTLATLVRDDEEIRHKTAQLKFSDAELALERARDLAGKELISREEVDGLTLEYQIAQQELAEAEWSLEKTNIRAPVSGRVTGRMIQVGKHVLEGNEIFQVTDFDPLIVKIYLPEADVLGLAEGLDVRIRLNADENIVFGGRIRQISPIVDVATGTVKVTIEASDSPQGVRPGSFVTVGIVRETRTDSLLLPREAVLRELQSAHVFVTDGETAEKREITLGLEEGEIVEALSGIAAGEQVIVAGQGGLKDGAEIKILGGEESDTVEAAASEDQSASVS